MLENARKQIKEATFALRGQPLPGRLQGEFHVLRGQALPGVLSSGSEGLRDATHPLFPFLSLCPVGSLSWLCSRREGGAGEG